MHRSVTLFVLLSFFTSVLFAQSLSIERAKTLVSENVELAYVAGSLNSPEFCVFNNVEKEGFVIVSSDDVFGAEGLVLGYSDEGEFDYDKLPDNARWLLSQYQEQIEYIRENNIAFDSKTSTKAGDIVVAPLLAGVKWNQSYPFNNLCPVDGASKSVTGCVATAMALIMWYHKWPLSGTGSHSYKWKSKTLSVDFSKSEYDWSHMPGKYNSGQFGTQDVNAVSRLMYDCGVAVEMEYSAGGSGAYAYQGADAFTKYFKYKTAVYKYRYGSSKSWDTTLKNELNSRRPVLVAGQSRDEGGHAFVCDGYDSNDYFHFNFGWGGIGDGYFLTSVTGGFSEGQEMIYQIVPDRDKLYCDGVYFNQLSADKVEVSSPDVADDEYSGRIVIPSEVTDTASSFSVTAIGAYAFSASDVSVLDIPKSVRSISPNAIFGCVELDSVFVHWDSPLDCDQSVFDNSTYSNTVLVVPHGKVGTYSKTMPWSLFSTIVAEDGSGEASDWYEWTLYSDNNCPYIFGWKDLDPQDDSYVVYSRSHVLSETTIQLKVDKWLSSSLIIDVDLRTGECKVPKQSTGIMVNGTDELIVSDYPSYNRSYNYKSYPCHIDVDDGVVSLNLVYSSGNSGGYYHMCVDSLFLAGYPEYDIALSKLSVSDAGEVTCTVEYAKDVAEYGYVLLPSMLSKQQQSQVLDDIKEGTVELEYTTARSLNFHLAESDTYTLLVASIDKGGKARKLDAGYISFMANEPNWVEEYTGSYYYQAWKKRTQTGVTLMHDANNPRYWKLTSMYEGTELIFRWYDDQTLEFDRQPSGFTNGESVVDICDNKFSDKTPKRGSYFDSSKNTLYFDTYYQSSVTKYAVEAFVIEGETAVDDILYDSAGVKPVIYDLYGRRLESPQKGLNIINGQKVYIE